MTRKEITDAFNSLFLDARKEYLEALKAESKTQYDKFIKDLGKHCIKLVRKMHRQISGHMMKNLHADCVQSRQAGFMQCFHWVTIK